MGVGLKKHDERLSITCSLGLRRFAKALRKRESTRRKITLESNPFPDHSSLHHHDEPSLLTFVVYQVHLSEPVSHGEGPLHRITTGGVGSQFRLTDQAAPDRSALLDDAENN